MAQCVSRLRGAGDGMVAQVDDPTTDQPEDFIGFRPRVLSGVNKPMEDKQLGKHPPFKPPIREASRGASKGSQVTSRGESSAKSREEAAGASSSVQCVCSPNLLAPLRSCRAKPGGEDQLQDAAQKNLSCLSCHVCNLNVPCTCALDQTVGKTRGKDQNKCISSVCAGAPTLFIRGFTI